MTIKQSEFRFNYYNLIPIKQNSQSNQKFLIKKKNNKPQPSNETKVREIFIYSIYNKKTITKSNTLD